MNLFTVGPLPYNIKWGECYCDLALHKQNWTELDWKPSQYFVHQHFKDGHHHLGIWNQIWPYWDERVALLAQLSASISKPG